MRRDSLVMFRSVLCSLIILFTYRPVHSRILTQSSAARISALNMYMQHVPGLTDFLLLAGAAEGHRLPGWICPFSPEGFFRGKGSIYVRVEKKQKPFITLKFRTC